MAIELKFSKANLEQLKLSDNKQIIYSDSDTQYLILIISQTKKVFYYYRKLKGYKSPKKIKLGEFPKMSVAVAKKRCIEKTRELLEGKFTHNNNITFKELFLKYYEKHLKPNTKRYKEAYRYFEKYLPTLHNKKMSAIIKEDIIDCHNLITKKYGPYTANRAVQLTGAAINWCKKNNIIDCDNPASNINLNEEYSRERFITPNEINTFLEAIETAPIADDKRDIIKCLLFIGQRKTNTMSMRIQDVNLTEKQWSIPGMLTKNKKPYKAELLDFIVDILKNRIKLSQQTSKYVFPAKSSTGHVTDIRKAWLQVKKTANELAAKSEGSSCNFDDLVMHDLRRTLGSWQVKMGASLYVTGQSLGHSDPNSKATKVYATILRDTVRGSIQKATDAMMSTGNTEKIDRIQQLKNIINEIDAESEEDFKKKVLEKFFEK